MVVFLYRPCFTSKSFSLWSYWRGARLDPINVVKKISIFGDPQVGKTALIQRFLFDRYGEDYTPTYGTSVYKKDVPVKDPSGATQGYKVTLLIWDMPGNKRYTVLHKAYYRGAEGGFVIMDAAEPSTLASVPEWVSLFREVVGPVPIILLVNKWDMVDKASYDMGPVRRVCKELDIGSMFSSGKSGENVKDMFLNLTEAILQVRPF